MQTFFIEKFESVSIVAVVGLAHGEKKIALFSNLNSLFTLKLIEIILLVEGITSNWNARILAEEIEELKKPSPIKKALWLK